MLASSQEAGERYALQSGSEGASSAASTSSSGLADVAGDACSSSRCSADAPGSSKTAPLLSAAFAPVTLSHKLESLEDIVPACAENNFLFKSIQLMLEALLVADS